VHVGGALHVGQRDGAVRVGHRRVAADSRGVDLPEARGQPRTALDLARSDAAVGVVDLQGAADAWRLFRVA